MTLWDLLRACLRRWPIVLVGAVLTAAAGFAITLDDGVYWTRAQVVFLAPSSDLYPNSLKTKSGDLIITAGIVAKRVMGAEKIEKYASPDATIVGATPIRDGYWVRLPDTGGQWATNFASQELLVEVVAPTHDRVVAVQQQVISRIAEELDALQREQKVDEVNDITVTVAPESTVVYQVKGSRPRALLMTAILGIGLTLASIMILEQRAHARRTTTEAVATGSRPG
jgi:hypothetical protein